MRTTRKTTDESALGVATQSNVVNPFREDLGCLSEPTGFILTLNVVEPRGGGPGAAQLGRVTPAARNYAALFASTAAFSLAARILSLSASAWVYQVGRGVVGGVTA